MHACIKQTSVGVSVGSAVGSSVGVVLGTTVGWFVVGTSVVGSTGTCFGGLSPLAIGANVRLIGRAALVFLSSVRRFVGVADGSAVGFSVGVTVGSEVGISDGDAEGAAVGLAVGLLVAYATR